MKRILSFAALLVVLSVMTGFDYDLREKLVGANAHLTIESMERITDPEPLIRTVAGTDHVVGVTPFIAGQAIVRLPDQAFGIIVRGLDVDRERRVSKLAEYVTRGRLPVEDKEIVLGSELAQSLGAGLNDPLKLISPADGETREFVVCGIFRSGMYEYDASLAGITLPAAQQLFLLPNAVTGLAVRLDAIEQAPAIKEKLESTLPPKYVVKTWTEQNKTLFDALTLEKKTMFVILALIVLVAAVNIVSTLVMMVTEKTRDIGILKAVGATRRSIQWIFRWQGLLIGGLGTALGVAGALGVIWIQETYQLVRLPSSIYYLDHLPVRVEQGDWAFTVLAAMAISWLATVYPARQAAKLDPVEALRFE